LSDLSKRLKISPGTLSEWDRLGFDIFDKSRHLHVFDGNRRLQRLWGNINHRCSNPNDKKYKFYGGRGIKVFLTKEDLLNLWERDKACLLREPSIDRIDSNKDYEIDNCRFIEMNENRTRRYYFKNMLTV
jgi:hypothetical protein